MFSSFSLASQIAKLLGGWWGGEGGVGKKKKHIISTVPGTERWTLSCTINIWWRTCRHLKLKGTLIADGRLFDWKLNRLEAWEWTTEQLSLPRRRREHLCCSEIWPQVSLHWGAFQEPQRSLPRLHFLVELLQLSIWNEEISAIPFVQMWLTQHSAMFLPKKSTPYLGWENTPNFHCDGIHQGEVNFNYGHNSGHWNLPRKGFYYPPKAPPWFAGPEPVGALHALTCAHQSVTSYQKAQDCDIMAVLHRMLNESPLCLGKPSFR